MSMVNHNTLHNNSETLKVNKLGDNLLEKHLVALVCPQTSQDEQIPDPSSPTPGSDEDIDNPETQVDVAKLCQEGEVMVINYLLSKVIPLLGPLKSPI